MSQLFEHQKRGIQKILDNNGIGALFWDMGLGKTRGAIEIFRELRKSDPTLKMVVVCPISLIESAWGEDIKKFSDYTYCNLREKVTQADIYLLNYEYLLTDKVKNLSMINAKMIVLDESSRIKNHRAQTTKTLLKLTYKFKYRVIMSGTPAPNIEWEYWPQIKFLNEYIFSSSFINFKNQFFHVERNGQVVMIGNYYSRAVMREMFSKGCKYAITRENREKLIEKIRPIADFARKEECLDLPERTDENILIELSPDQKRAYKEMKTELVAEIKDTHIVASVALVKLMKLREITSGFAFDIDQNLIEFESNPKLRELEQVLEDIGDRQVIIWCNFTYEIEKIKSILGDQAECIYGKTKDKDAVIEGFKNGRIKYLIANPSSAGYGLTFVNCNYQVFFSLSYSWEDYEQSRDRIYRIGQVNKCTYIHLLARGTIDETILNVLKRKGDSSDFVFKFMEGVQ